MDVKSLAVLSMHTSPLAQPGTGDGGGLNVYVSELATSMAHLGVACDIFARRSSHNDDEIVEIEPGVRVIHVDAGPPSLAKEQLPAVITEFTDGVIGTETTTSYSVDTDGEKLFFRVILKRGVSDSKV